MSDALLRDLVLEEGLMEDVQITILRNEEVHDTIQKMSDLAVTGIVLFTLR